MTSFVTAGDHLWY